MLLIFIKQFFQIPLPPVSIVQIQAMLTLPQILQKNAILFTCPVPFSPTKDQLLQMDFGEDDTLFTDQPLDNPYIMQQCIEDLLEQKKALYGVGGYGVLRAIYGRSTLFDAENEPRRFHIGCDIFGKVGTPVLAPLASTVHSFAINPALGDYGGTIILQHSLENAIFYTLYGHLSHQSVAGLAVGQHIKQAEPFATFGNISENGNWSPHLHFQIIDHIGNYQGDYPGVCRYSERDHYLANCPNPNYILQMNNLLA